MDENVAVGKEELEVVKLEVVKDGAKQEVVVQDAEDNAGENVQEQSPEVLLEKIDVEKNDEEEKVVDQQNVVVK